MMAPSLSPFFSSNLKKFFSKHILSFILNLASDEGPPDLVVIPGCEGTHVVSLLLLMVKLVLILEMEKQSRWVTVCALDAPRMFA